MKVAKLGNGLTVRLLVKLRKAGSFDVTWMRARRGRLPKDFKFNRVQANERTDVGKT